MLKRAVQIGNMNKIIEAEKKWDDCMAALNDSIKNAQKARIKLEKVLGLTKELRENINKNKAVMECNFFVTALNKF